MVATGGEATRLGGGCRTGGTFSTFTLLAWWASRTRRAVGHPPIRAIADSTLGALPRRTGGTLWTLSITTGTLVPIATLATIAAPLVGVNHVDTDPVGHRLADDLERFGPGLGRFRCRNRHDEHAIEPSIGLGADDVAHPDAGIEQCGIENTLGLAGTGSAPGPLTLAFAGEFNVNAVRHTAVKPSPVRRVTQEIPTYERNGPVLVGPLLTDFHS